MSKNNNTINIQLENYIKNKNYTMNKKIYNTEINNALKIHTA